MLILRFASMLAMLALVPCFMAGPARGGEDLVKPTLFSMDFFGYIDGAKPGDRILVRDADGTVCGAFTVVREGQYGFLHVYGDDKTTAEDEGADPNDRLTFTLNGSPLIPLSLRDVLWIGDGQRMHLNFLKR